MTPPDPSEEFVSEAIVPVPGTADAAAMSRGEPGLPARFHWRGREYQLASILATWKTTGIDRGEVYLRRHWYSILTLSGEQMTLYCERQAKHPGKPKARWWLYTIRRQIPRIRAGN